MVGRLATMLILGPLCLVTPTLTVHVTTSRALGAGRGNGFIATPYRVGGRAPGDLRASQTLWPL